jgi:hypothetical protein
VAIVDFETRYHVPIIEGYGPESTVALAVNPIGGPRKAGTVGRSLPDIEVAVVGRPDSVMGEEPVAFVVAGDGQVICPADLLKTARSVLAKFKVAKEIRVVDALPRNAVGKWRKPR